MSDLPRVLSKGFAFRRKLSLGKPLAGAWSTLGSADVAITMSRAGLDYILVDLEHGLGGIDGLARQVQALLSLDTAVMVRLPDHSAGSIKRVLDVGANALLVPQVDTADQVREILDASQFAPDGTRGVAVGAIAAADNGYLPEIYFENANEALTVLVQIESRAALENHREMLTIPRLDGVFVGPNDLSASMGVFRKYESAEFSEAFETVRKSTLASGKLFGALPFPGNNAENLWRRGAQVVPNGSDQVFLRNGASALVNKARDP